MSRCCCDREKERDGQLARLMNVCLPFLGDPGVRTRPCIKEMPLWLLHSTNINGSTEQNDGYSRSLSIPRYIYWLPSCPKGLYLFWPKTVAF